MSGSEHSINVVKESGELEPFRITKVKEALRRAGLRGKDAQEVIDSLRPKLHERISTKRIYRLVSAQIQAMRPDISHKYNLKRALFDLGPAGYLFEDFMARLLDMEGYKTQVRQKLQGRCVNHEVDIIASKGQEVRMVECKFHNHPGMRCRIQTILYSYARFLDLQEGAGKGTCRRITKPWLITNTKFSEDVITYAECKDLPLLGWRYPFRESLERRIDRSRCYPVTVIKMRKETSSRLLRKGMVSVHDIPRSPSELDRVAGIGMSQARRIVEQAGYAR